MRKGLSVVAFVLGICTALCGIGVTVLGAVGMGGRRR